MCDKFRTKNLLLAMAREWLNCVAALCLLGWIACHATAQLLNCSIEFVYLWCVQINGLLLPIFIASFKAKKSAKEFVRGRKES